MRLRLRTALVIQLFPFAVAITLFPASALACTCSLQSINERYENSQVIFTGDAIRYIKSARGTPWTTIRFTPIEAWKGAGGSSIDIEVPTQDASCSVEILIGHRYLVYATADTNGELQTTLCMGSREMSMASKEDLAYLSSRSGPTLPRPQSFSDVPTDHLYAQSIHDFRKKGIVRGFADGSFRPERHLTRAEAVQILAEYFLPQDAMWRHESEYAFTSVGLPFSDIDQRAWYNLALRRTFRAGIISGYPDGTFRPSNTVTVAEGIKLIVEVLALDTDRDGALWYERYVRAAAHRQALPITMRDLGSGMKRGEFVEILWRLTNHVEDRESLTADELLSPTCVTSKDSEIPRVDMRKVREKWLEWYNDYRATKGLKRYTYNPYLTRSAALWSDRAANNGFIDHVRDGTIGAYNYEAVRDWFQSLGLEFQNVQGVTFTENIGWGPYTCNEDDCTEALIASIRETFNYYLSERDLSYRPHYNAIINPFFTIMGLGISIRNETYYLTVHFGTEFLSNPPRLCGI